MDDKAECIFNEQVHVKEEEDNIKEEPEWEDNAGLRGISAAAARAGLYAKHEVKDELVLGPERVQPADIAFRLYACQASAARAQPVLRDCVARPERSADALRPERHVANNADVGKQVHSNANIHTEKKTYLCDICNKRFALKTQLVEHVMIHIHQEPEQEEVRVADNACQASAARAQPVLRDCVARPERSADARRPERHVANNADVGKQVHSNASIHTKKETYVCDICNKKFALKTQLVGHVMIHIDQEPEQEEVRVADNAKEIHGNIDDDTEKETYICDTCKKWFPRKSQLVDHVMSHIQRRESGRGSARAPNAREHLALRDCVVRLELLELVDLEAGRDERLASRAGRDTDIEKEIHGNSDVNTEGETYICDTCKKWFPRKSQLVDHVMSHIQRRESGRGSARAPNAREHPALRDCVVRLERLELVDLEAGRDETFASRAGRDTDIEKEIHGNIDVNTEEETYICDTCKKWFPRKSQLVDHVMSHIQRRESGRGSARGGRGEGREPARGGRGEGREPVRDGRGEGREPARDGRGEGREPTHALDRRHACLICYKDFSVPSKLKYHERIHTAERPFCCGICKQKFKELDYLKRHERIHTGEKPYSCGICTKKFAWLSSLKSHESTHSGEKPFYCRICKQKFKHSGHVKRHERTHTGERPFCCAICKQKFARLITLKRHERIHTGEKPFPCGICTKKFSRSHHLKRHERTHTGEKPFACDMCEKLFTQLENLKEHKDRIHADRKPFCCDICQKRFTQKTTLVGHIRRHSTAKPR